MYKEKAKLCALCSMSLSIHERDRGLQMVWYGATRDLQQTILCLDQYPCFGFVWAI